MAGEPILLSGGHTRIVTGYDNTPVRTWIAAAPGWKGEAWCRLDALIDCAVPDVQKAVKWISPLYGPGFASWVRQASRLPGEKM